MRPALPLLFAALLAPLAAGAQPLMPWHGSAFHADRLHRAPPPLGFSHSVTGRFGVATRRDAVSGERVTEPVGELGVWLHWNHQTDNGWHFGISLGLVGGVGEGLLDPRR